MKYTIEGFSQEYAMTLREKVEVDGKIIEKKIDCTDLVILRWFVDFYPKMKKLEVDGVQYAWVSRKKLIEDLPLVDISEKAFSERMQRLVYFGILTYRLIKEGGTFSVYGFGKNYGRLICQSDTVGVQTDTVGVQTDTGCAVECTGGGRSNGQGVAVQTTTKDISISNNTISNTSIRDIIKEKESVNTKEKEKSIDEVIAAQKEKLQEPLREFVKMRKSIKKPITTHGLELVISKLRKLSGGHISVAEEIINQSIMNGWQGVFALKEEPVTPTKKKSDGSEYANLV